MERKILRTLSYRLPTNSLYEEVHIKFSSILFEEENNLDSGELAFIKDSINFYCVLALYDHEIFYSNY